MHDFAAVAADEFSKRDLENLAGLLLVLRARALQSVFEDPILFFSLCRTLKVLTMDYCMEGSHEGGAIGVVAR